MELTIIANPSAPHQKERAEALAAGARRHGLTARVEQQPRRAHSHVVACWGWRMGALLRAMGKEVLVMERGYIGDRFAWTSLGWNGLNGRARFEIPDDGGARFRAHFGAILRPWRVSGSYALLIHQVPGDASLQGRSLAGWYALTAKAAADAYGLPIRFRLHPVAVARGCAQNPAPGTTLIGGSLDDALAGAAVCLTWNSNVGVDAALAGCPVVAQDAGSMACPVAGERIGDYCTPAREEWAARLAWCQWTEAEIASGAAWEVVGREYHAHLAAAD